MKKVSTAVIAALAVMAVGPVAYAGPGGMDALVRVFHGSPDTPPVDVVVNNNFATPAFEDVAFRDFTPYAMLPEAMYNFKVVVANTMMDPAPIDADVAVAGGTAYTIAAAGELANIQPVVFQDDNTIEPGMARARLLHLSPNAPAVNVVVANGGPTIFSNVSFTEASGYESIMPGTYDLEVRLASNDALALSLPGVTLDGSTVYSIAAVGLVGSDDTPLGVELSVDAIPEPGTVSLLAAGALLALRRRRTA